MIEFTCGDMFDRSFDVRVNTVNCVGVMGAGVALAFKERYPEMFREYKRECDAHRIKPGKLHVWKNLHGDWVINFPTKRHWRDKSRYEDIEAGLKVLRDYLKDLHSISVALPALGCGHGGLEWKRVSRMIRNCLKDVPAHISVFEPNDSRAIGAKVLNESKQVNRVDLEGAGVEALTSEDPSYPPGLRELHAQNVFYHGPAELFRSAAVALMASFRPEERETTAVRALTEMLAREAAVLSVVLTGNRMREMIDTAVDQGAKVIAWIPRGLLSEPLPTWVEELVRAKNLVVASVAPPKAGWMPSGARQASDAAAAASAAVVVADPEPVWLSRAQWRPHHEKAHSLFYVRYREASDSARNLWEDIDATPISRNATTGNPNVESILALLNEAMQRDRALLPTQEERVTIEETNSDKTDGLTVSSPSKQASVKDPTRGDRLFDDDEPKEPRARRKSAAEQAVLAERLPPNLGKPFKVKVPDFSDPNRPKTCLEVDFPIVPINVLSALEGNAGKPIYQMSKWWARRRSCVFRALLLAAAMEAPTRKHPDGQPMMGLDGKPIVDEDAAAQLVWDAYYANHQLAGNFKNLKVLDPFMGGGTTLVEGSRLGFQVAGIDLNPVAWFIVKNELACTDPAEVKALFDQIEAEVKPQIQPFYVTDGVGGRKGTWFEIGDGGSRKKMPAEFNPAELPHDQRNAYSYEGPEIVYTFWAKHGPCIKPGCGHRTPIFRSPVVATKKLGVKYLECTCKKCKTAFHAELGDARIAPDAGHVVLDTEQTYTVVSGKFAKAMLDYDKGERKEIDARIEYLTAQLESEPGLKCPRCAEFSGQFVRDILAKHASAGRYSNMKKKDFNILPKGVGKKPVYCTLLIDPEWLKGSPGEIDGKELGGYIDATVEATQAWYRERLKNLRLIEVRGTTSRASLPESEVALTPGSTEEEAEAADEEGEKSWIPATITLPDRRVIETRKGTVPKRSCITCGSCGQLADLLDACKSYTDRARMKLKDSAAQRSLPVMVYVLQCYDPVREAEGHPYGGKYFKTADAADIDRMIGSEREWVARRKSDLQDYWPRSALPYTWMTHHLNGGIPNWGYTHWYKFFNPRQLLLHAQLLKRISGEMQNNESVAFQALGAFQQYLRNQSMFSFYHGGRDCLAPTLSNAHFHPKSLVIESPAFLAIGYGSWPNTLGATLDGLEYAQKPWERVETLEGGSTKTISHVLGDVVRSVHTLVQGSSTEMRTDWNNYFDNVVTDPPFGDNLFYGDLSNFFYVWLRLALRGRYPDQFAPEYVPRSQEAVADRSRFPNIETDEEAAMSAANAAYQGLMTACWAESRRVMKDGGVMTFTFHHSADEPWMSILQSLFESGWLLEATYPIRSDETKGEGGQFGSRKIEYDIIHVCRKRLEEPKPVSWPKMRQWVKAELLRLRPLLESYKSRGLQDADVRVILRGKALEFYSRHYGRVLVSAPGGEDTVLSIRDALLGINQLLDESSGQPGERPPSIVQPVVYQYLRLFGSKASYSRDEVSKLLRGTAIQQRDFEQTGSTPWIDEDDRVITRVPVYDRFQKMVKRPRRELKTELDQAHFLIGAAMPAREGDTTINIEKDLERETFLIRPGVEALLDWYSRTPSGGDEPDVPRAASVSLQLLRAAFEAKRARMRQEDPRLFEEWEASMQTVA